MTTASDDFTRGADEVPAAAPWLSVNVVGDIVGGARIDGTFDYLWAGGGAVRVSLYDGGTSWAADQTVDAVVGALGGGAHYAILVARFDVSGNGYAVDTDGPTATIYRVTAGLFTSIKATSITFVNGDTIGIRCAGNAILLRKNGADVDSVTDTTYPTGGRPGAGAFGNATIDAWLASDAGAVTREQKGHRYGADDGSESAHTWLDAQGADVSRAPDQPFRVRMGVQAVGDVAAAAYQLEWRKVGDPNWTKAE